MKKLLLAFFLLASCSSSDEPNNQSAGASQPGNSSAKADDPRSGKAPIASLTGLYEGGEGKPKNQMCVVEGKGGEQRFGLIVWGSNLHSCMGSGTVTREGDRLRLSMAGDSACTIEATVSGNQVRLPASVPQGCAYYCGQRASLTGAILEQSGTTEEAAMQAKDLVGESLCAGEAG
jgi:hypothetical protein